MSDKTWHKLVPHGEVRVETEESNCTFERDPAGSGQMNVIAKNAVVFATDLEPIPMVLYCPACGAQHIDKADPLCENTAGCAFGAHGPNGETQCGYCGSPPPWSNPPHRSHECQKCHFTFRPADVPTTGVERIETKGKLDGTYVTPVEQGRLL